MELPSNLNKMNFRKREVKITYLKEAIASITLGTVIGLVVYEIFLILHIDIFGWNLGLIFAPLAAGYAETYLAHKLIGQDIGAISAFILFAVTTFYSFILKNPTLGINFITIGSIAVILQAAFPTLINYILLVVGLGIISYFLGIFARITHFVYNKMEYFYHKYITKKPQKVIIETPIIFDENKSNERLNGLGFYFITSTDVTDKKIKNLGQFHETVIIEKDKRLIHSNPKKAEREQLNKLKQAKDECLVKLSDQIKQNGGNGVVDLEIRYSLIGIGGDSFQISAMGMGVELS